MQFLADVFVPCDQCDGMRFKPQVLEVRYRGKSVHQVLDMTVREALTFFSQSPKVLSPAGAGRDRARLPATGSARHDVVGWRSAAHQDRCAPGVVRRRAGALHPGRADHRLHFDDIAKLLAAFRKLVEAGHSLLVIEHNLDVIKTADYVIDLGPEGGEAGGRVVLAVRAGRPGRGFPYWPGPQLVLATGRPNACGALILRHVLFVSQCLRRIEVRGATRGDEDRKAGDR